MCFPIQRPQKRYNRTIRLHSNRYTITKGHNATYFGLLRPNLRHQDQEMHSCTTPLRKPSIYLRFKIEDVHSFDTPSREMDRSFKAYVIHNKLSGKFAIFLNSI